ncbi:uncharacterized protein ACBT44_019131 isoform 1-T1 [Syngnathus typhle]
MLFCSAFCQRSVSKVMWLNNTCLPVNGTECAAPTSPVGLAVGLTLFFLMLVTIGVMITVGFCKDEWNLPLLGQKESQQMECIQTPQGDHQYVGMIRTQSTENPSIYENMEGQKSGAGSQSRPSHVPAENLYLQCDPPDDAIYSNYPACNLAFLPESRDDDVYIFPES